MLKVSDFDYSLPQELIAQEPSSVRDQSRLMILNRARKTIEHRAFHEIIKYLKPDDLLVLNDTKVIPARVFGRRETGGKVELLLLRKTGEGRFESLVKPGHGLKEGSRIILDDELFAEVLEVTPSGERILEFNAEGDFEKILERIGEVPLPPYVKIQNSSRQRRDKMQKLKERYQTIYAKNPGASAAPTAGLHFTEELLGGTKRKGVGVAYITLHTGLATFRPVLTEFAEQHQMYKEYFEISKGAAEAVGRAKRVIAVGTTTARALEATGGKEGRGETNLFIYPGYRFKAVDALITNFHFPRSTLLMLVSAFADREFILRAYEEAIAERYRFYSFGDAMLIL